MAGNPRDQEPIWIGSKVQVRFLELTDTIPFMPPEGEVVGKPLTSACLALLDGWREIMVLQPSVCRQHEIAERLGYAPRPIAKKLARIRCQTEALFELASDSSGWESAVVGRDQ